MDRNRDGIMNQAQASVTEAAAMAVPHDKVLIVDFGSQVTQLIAPPCARGRGLLRDRAL